MFGRLGPLEITLLVLVVLLLFGAKRLPDTARALGKSLRILKSETKAMQNDGKDRTEAKPASDAAPQPAPRTIQAAPGDVAGARPVADPDRTQTSTQTQR